MICAYLINNYLSIISVSYLFVIALNLPFKIYRIVLIDDINFIAKIFLANNRFAFDVVECRKFKIFSCSIVKVFFLRLKKHNV